MPIPEVLRELTASEHFLVTIHVNPDGDAIGSLLGMTRLLESLGKRAVPVSHDPVFERYMFLEGADKVRTVEQAKKEGPFDAMVILDAGAFDRIGDVQTLLNDDMKVVNVDHHISNDGFGKASWIDTEASATCEMMVELYRHAGVAIEADVAEMLYTGIMTDTGRFRFSNTSARVFASCANLVARGADPARITEMIYFRSDPQVLRVMGHVLARYELTPGREVAISWLEDSEEGTDTEGFVDMLMSIEGVEVAVMLRPVGKEQYKASFRSTGDVNVSELAMEFNGGGHAKAAGGRLEGPLDVVRKQVVDACLRAVRQNGG